MLKHQFCPIQPRLTPEAKARIEAELAVSPGVYSLVHQRWVSYEALERGAGKRMAWCDAQCQQVRLAVHQEGMEPVKRVLEKHGFKAAKALPVKQISTVRRVEDLGL